MPVERAAIDKITVIHFSFKIYSSFTAAGIIAYLDESGNELKVRTVLVCTHLVKLDCVNDSMVDSHGSDLIVV